MAIKVLVTGAAGYVGGSIATELVASGAFEESHVYATARAKEQVDAISAAGINACQLELTDEQAVNDLILKNEIQLVIHTATSIDPKPAALLIAALAELKKSTAKKTYFVHTSGHSAFCPITGWPEGEIKDSGPIFEVEKELADSFPLRTVDVAVTEQAEAAGVEPFIVVPTAVYGRGTGRWNQLSVIIPMFIKASMEQRAVHKFDENKRLACVHITDLVALYMLLVQSIVKQKPIPSGKEGYYFAIAHEEVWHDITGGLATRLYRRGKISDPNTAVWPSDEAAAQALGVPVGFLHVLFNSEANVVSQRPQSIGWNPKWRKEHFLDNLDQEISDVVELGQAKSSLAESLRKAAQG